MAIPRESLFDYLRSQPSGPVECTRLLFKTWHEFEGGDAEGMQEHKVLRAQNMNWEPPLLTFGIERHGAIVAGGSAYAEIQSWVLDVERRTAWIVDTRKRRVRPIQAAVLDTEALADDLVRAVLAGGRDDERLRWSGPSFQVRMNKVLPEAPKQTTEGRRKRLNAALEKRLAPLGWSRTYAGWWAKLAEELEGE